MVQIIPLVKLFGVYSAFETLYIPHGSDNTNSPIDDWLIKLLDFISHMVQIILASLCYKLNILFQALYPTWFR